jgi:hypothetical protein
VNLVARETSQKNFEQYFENATYYEWDDLESPIIQVSQDSSIAWMITRIKVRRTQFGDSGEQLE